MVFLMINFTFSLKLICINMHIHLYNMHLCFCRIMEKTEKVSVVRVGTI